MIELRKLLALLLPFLTITAVVLYLSYTNLLEYSSVTSTVCVAAVVGGVVTGAYLTGLMVAKTKAPLPTGANLDLAISPP